MKFKFIWPTFHIRTKLTRESRLRVSDKCQIQLDNFLN